MSQGRDPLGRALELGLAAVVIAAPMPFGAVIPEGRLTLELAASLLLAIWTVRATRQPTRLPPVAVVIGCAGLLALAVLQTVPLPHSLSRAVAPRATQIRDESRPPAELLMQEAKMLRIGSGAIRSPATVSLDPWATTSGLRTGVALVALLFVATTVAAERGFRVIATALLMSAAFQAFYGMLILFSGHDYIWNVPKQYALGSSTGTFVNRNHFAGMLAEALPCGAALVMQDLDELRAHGGSGWRERLFSPSGNRILLMVIMLVIGIAGLLTSFSRAGIALGLLALLVTLVAGRRGRLRARVAVAAVTVAIAVLPLTQIGFDRLIRRYEHSAKSLQESGGRSTVWGDTVSMATDFPLLGSGFGTFAVVYPLYRSDEVRKFYQYAHCDLLQVAAEGGAVGVTLVLLVLIPLGSRTLRGLRGVQGILGVGVAAGLAAVLLHSLVDFDFHIPSNAAIAVILAGGVLGLPWINES